MKLVLVPRTQRVMEEYASWFIARKLPLPILGTDTLFIADPRGVLAGVCLYPTEGGFILVEHLATNPAAPMKTRHRAVVALAKAVRVYAAAKSKYPVAVVRSRGILRVMLKEGFAMQPGVVVQAEPLAEAP